MVAAATRFVPPSFHVDALLIADDAVTIPTRSNPNVVHCPVCGEPADRIHRRAIRILADLPCAGIVVHLQVQVRKCFFDNPNCLRQIFSKRLAGVARSVARRTERRRAALLDVAVALGGEAGDSRPGSIVPKRVGLMT